MSFTTRPEIKGTFGVVSSTHWIAASVAIAALERGGNAFDAATAAGFTLQVVEPHQNGLGGDVPIIFWNVARKRIEVVCGQGPAPAGATISHYRSLGLELVPGAGLLAAVVPGVFDAWMLLFRDHGTASLGAVLEPLPPWRGAVRRGPDGASQPRLPQAMGDIHPARRTAQAG